MQKVLLLQEDDIQFIEKLADKVAEKLKPSLQTTPSSSVKEKVYLTRKDAAKKLGISPPSVDKFVLDGVLPKLGLGKRGRFRLEDVENLFENLNKYYYQQRKSPYKELKKENS